MNNALNLCPAIIGIISVFLSTTLYSKPVEAPSTVKAHYVKESTSRMLQPGEKIEQLFTKNAQQDYILQRMSQRTYFFQRQYYSTIFYIGDNGVLLFDPLKDHSDFIRKAITKVTSLPITAIVYSHNHSDHVAGAQSVVDALAKAGLKPRIIASQATADKMIFLNSKHPKPTETVSWPKGSFEFEGLSVQLHGFERGGHTDDSGVWLLTNEKVAHLPDYINGDQLPFLNFAAAESFTYYQENLKQLAKLDWSFLSAGHGNVAAKSDVNFYLTYINDLKAAIGKGFTEVPVGKGVDFNRVNSHTEIFGIFFEQIAESVRKTMRAKYGKFYGFEAAIAGHTSMATMEMFLY